MDHLVLQLVIPFVENRKSISNAFPIIEKDIPIEKLCAKNEMDLFDAYRAKIVSIQTFAPSLYLPECYDLTLYNSKTTTIYAPKLKKLKLVESWKTVVVLLHQILPKTLSSLDTVDCYDHVDFKTIKLPFHITNLRCKFCDPFIKSSFETLYIEGSCLDCGINQETTILDSTVQHFGQNYVNKPIQNVQGIKTFELSNSSFYQHFQYLPSTIQTLDWTLSNLTCYDLVNYKFEDLIKLNLSENYTLSSLPENVLRMNSIKDLNLMHTSIKDQSKLVLQYFPNVETLSIDLYQGDIECFCKLVATRKFKQLRVCAFERLHLNYLMQLLRRHVHIETLIIHTSSYFDRFWPLKAFRKTLDTTVIHFEHCCNPYF